MPRKARGGPNNRTDLLSTPAPPTPSQLAPPNPQPKQPQNQPIRVATGQKYGENQAQREAQQAIPLPQTRPQMGDIQTAAKSFDYEAHARPLGGPSRRPAEPITAGLPFGPGANSLPGAPPDRSIAATLAKLAETAPELNGLVQLARSQNL